jgi:hypothetical protein
MQVPRPVLKYVVPRALHSALVLEYWLGTCARRKTRKLYTYLRGTIPYLPSPNSNQLYPITHNHQNRIQNSTHTIPAVDH